MKRLIIFTLIFVAFSAVGYADNESAISSATGNLGGGFGGNFTTQLANLSRSVMAAGQTIAVIMTAIAGVMVCLGINDGTKTLWNWILGIGLAINFGDLIVGLWSVQSPSGAPQVADYQLLLKNENDPDLDILSPFMRYYISVVMQGAAAIAPYAVNLTLILAMLDGGIKVSLDLIGGDKVEYLVKMVLKVGFFVFLIQSWVGTTSNFQLMPALSSGFETMGYTAGGAPEMIREFDSSNPDSNVDVQSNQIVTNALNFFNIFWQHAQAQNILTTVVSLICVVTAVVVLFLTALEMFMVRIEFWTMALLTIPLLSFGVIEQLKFLSDKAIAAMFNLATKIFVIAFIATMSVNILTGLVENARTVGESSDFVGNVSYFLQVLLYALILFLITKKIPELVSGLLSGNPSLSGGSMKQMAMEAANSAKNVVNAVAKGGNAVGAVYGGMSALSKAAGPMAQWGGKGSLGKNAVSFADAVGGKAMSMAKQGAIAGKNALKYRNPVYQGYQNAVSSLGNAANGLLNKDSDGRTRADANSSGIRPSEMLQDLSQGKNPTTTASQKVGSMMNGIGNKVGDFFTPPQENTSGLDMSKPAGSQMASSMSGEMRANQMQQNSSQTTSAVSNTASQDSANSMSRSPRSTPNMILHNLMNAENSQSSQFEGRRPYEPRNNAEPTDANQNSATNSSSGQNMSEMRNAPSANVNPISTNGEMRQGANNISATGQTSNFNSSPSSSDMSEMRSTPSANVNPISTSGEMRQGANNVSATGQTSSANSSPSSSSSSSSSGEMTELRSAATPNTGSNTTAGGMRQNVSSVTDTSTNSAPNVTTSRENSGTQTARSGE